MMTSPEVSWLFFKARAKRPYLSHTGRASNAEKQPTGPGPEGCVENGPAAALLVGYVSIQICALLAPCRRPILNATTSPLFTRRYTSRVVAVSAFGPAPKPKGQADSAQGFNPELYTQSFRGTSDPPPPSSISNRINWYQRCNINITSAQAGRDAASPCLLR